MKRTALIAALVVIVAGVGLSWFLGSRVRLAHERFLAGLVESPDLRIQAQRFDAGWFSSVAEVEAELGGAPGQALKSWLEAAGHDNARARVGLHVRQEIDHGPSAWWGWLTAIEGPPVVAVIVTEVALDQEARSDWAAEHQPLTALTRIRAYGTSDTALSVPEQALRVKPGEESEGPGATALWRGLYAYVVHPLGGARLDGTISGQGFVQESGADRLAVGPFEGRFELRRGPGADFRATLAGELASLATETVGDPASWQGLEGFHLDLVFTGRDGVLDLGVNASSGAARYDGVDASRVLARFGLRDLDAGMLAALDAQEREVATSAALAELARWLERAPSADPLELAIETDRGRLHVTGRIEVEPSAAADPLGVLDHLRGELRIEADKAPTAALAPELHAMLLGMAEDGLLSRTPSGVRGRLVLEDGDWLRGDGLRGDWLRGDGLHGDGLRGAPMADATEDPSAAPPAPATPGTPPATSAAAPVPATRTAAAEPPAAVAPSAAPSGTVAPDGTEPSGTPEAPERTEPSVPATEPESHPANESASGPTALAGAPDEAADADDGAARADAVNPPADDTEALPASLAP